MSRRRPFRCIAGLVASWFVLSTLAPAITVVHAHAGGETPHALASAKEPARLAFECQFAQRGIVCWHAHVLLGGLEFHVPFPADADAACHAPQMPVTHTADLREDTAHEPFTLPVATGDFVARGAEPRKSWRSRRLFDCRISQLCDRARQERSGVLLA